MIFFWIIHEKYRLFERYTWAGYTAKLVEHLLSMCEALGSNHTHTHTHTHIHTHEKRGKDKK